MNTRASTFNAIIRVFHTTNPSSPRRSPTKLPRIPEGADGHGINDGHMDENGIMYVVDRLQRGLYILEKNI